MALYESIHHDQIRGWCEASALWPAVHKGQPGHVALGATPRDEAELDRIPWAAWLDSFERRRLKAVFDPSHGTVELRPRVALPED